MQSSALSPAGIPTTPSPPLRPHRRIVELDALRALAAISLVMFHLTYVYAEKYGFTRPLSFRWHYGIYGTEMFFILSGFVNSMSLLRRGRPLDFVVARLIRIVPVFLIAIAANLLVLHMAPVQTEVSTAAVLANLTLLPKVFGYECLDPVMWTLQVEMLFYAVLVVLFRTGMLRRYFVGWGTLLLLSITVCPALDALETTASGSVWFSIATGARHLLVLDFVPLFAIGFAIYMIKTGVGRWWQNGLLIAAAVTTFHSIDHGKHHPMATIGLIALVTACAYGRMPILRIKPLLYISTISYALYLFHNNFSSVIMHRLNHGGVSPEIAFAAAIAFSWSMAVIVTIRIEGPMTRMLRSHWDRYRVPM